MNMDEQMVFSLRLISFEFCLFFKVSGSMTGFILYKYNIHKNVHFIYRMWKSCVFFSKELEVFPLIFQIKFVLNEESTLIPCKYS